MKIEFYMIFIMVLFKQNIAFTPVYFNYWVVWNVGQGQWVTHITPDTCLHYDAGGESKPFLQLKKTFLSYCGDKNNQIHLSHWDLDHYSYIYNMARTIPKICWRSLPSFGQDKKTAQSLIQLNIKPCFEISNNTYHWLQTGAQKTNDSSTIFFENSFLMTGDSPASLEKIWSQDFKAIENTKILILGHHGSRTSTSRNLLLRLPDLKLAVASARYAKYRHPHRETLARLNEFNIPVLKTEDWGNIWFVK